MLHLKSCRRELNLDPRFPSGNYKLPPTAVPPFRHPPFRQPPFRRSAIRHPPRAIRHSPSERRCKPSNKPSSNYAGPANLDKTASALVLFAHGDGTSPRNGTLPARMTELSSTFELCNVFVLLHTLSNSTVYATVLTETCHLSICANLPSRKMRFCPRRARQRPSRTRTTSHGSSLRSTCRGCWKEIASDPPSGNSPSCQPLACDQRLNGGEHTLYSHS